MTDERQGPRRDALLAAAAATFAARGFGGTSMREIAHDSGVSLSGIYYYVPSKDSLLYEIQARTVDALLASAAQALASVTRPRDQLLRFIESHIEYSEAHPAFVRVLTHETGSAAGEQRAIIVAKRSEYAHVLRDILHRVADECAAAVPADFGVNALFALLAGPNQWGVSDTGMNAGEMSRRVYDLFLTGFTGRAEGAST